ncbi:peptidase, C39 family [Synechococcus sp. PCC 7335]|uniref:NHLP family bacteriocin export ABC transporter peptidase/permease/ATPase subunit n=1 Tax=Synechococcus sp. (strain ATCC 29403 / PCC 7335) TaxID=91464 RepID=UPI00017EE781|nr:NHLP family bacteriocin export ABC transporter peptidase/permease/ATPase subunit [Synechococcus sp. PCC 7335]EDX85089.1 peptidase, C39 family [Synechococcus sp. PCC 7335]
MTASPMTAQPSDQRQGRSSKSFNKKPNHQSASKQRPKRSKTPTVFQMEAVECGAAALSMVLGYYGRFIPLAELRASCGVSRDGVTAANVLKAARNYGLLSKGYKKSIDSLKALAPPFIVFWNFNHFLVVDEITDTSVRLNDPALGPRKITPADFDEGYTGIVLTFTPGEDFVRGGRPASAISGLRRRLSGSVGALVFCALTGFLLVLPTLALPAFSRIFIDNVLLAKRLDWLPYVLLGMGITVLLQAVLTGLQLRYLRSLRVKLAVGMTSRFVWHVLRLPVGFYAQRFAGEISDRISLNDGVAGVLSGRLTTTAISMVMIVFYAIAMWQYDIPLTLIVVSFAAINVMTLQWVSRTRTDANRRLAQEYGKASGVSIAGLQSIETLKASGIESDFFARWAGYYTKATNAQQELGLTNRLLGLLPALLTMLTTLALLIIGGWRVIHGSLSIGMLVAFQLLMQSFQGPVRNLVGFANTLQVLQGNLERLDDVLENEVDIVFDEGPSFGKNTTQTSLERSHANHRADSQALGAVGESDHQKSGDQQISKGAQHSPHFRLSGTINITNLSFSYSPLDAPLIKDFNLSIQPGERIAFVGGSGSGKSTLVKIIAGLYQPTVGEICFDNKPRREIPRAVITNSVAMVEQDILLFAGSIRDNLTLWDSTVPDAQLQQACQDAAIEEAILALPYGYDAQLLEGGQNLSGGQRQRLEIARALVNNPSILIMDEATSALDSETEKIIDQNLRRRGCTCLIVAHRLSTIRDADEIIVLERGQVVQRGTHEELWRQEGHYATLINQSGTAL